MNITPGNWHVSNGVLIRIASHIPGKREQPVVVAGVHRVGKFTGYDLGDPLENAHLLAAAPKMYRALEMSKRLIDEALPRFDWGKSHLDAGALALLNEVPGVVARAMMQARGEI